MEITKVLPMLTTAAGWSPLAGVGERLSGERGVEWSMVPTRGYPPPCSTAPPWFVIMEKAPTRAFSWLKAATTAYTFKTPLRHYAKWALTPQSLNVKLGPRHNYHEGRAAIRHYANRTARPL